MNKENTLFNNKTIKRLVSDIQITVKQKKAVDKWLNYLKDKKLQNEIDKTDNKINQMVYELYGLTESGIQIMEGK